MNKQSLFTKCILGFGLLSSSFAFAGMTFGGVSGGGGNSRVSGFLPPLEVAQIIEQSFLDVLVSARMVGHLHLANPGVMPAGLTAMYSRPMIIEQALNKIKINIKMADPCVGTDGSENDGWFNPATPNEICISAFNLSKKVNASEMGAQVKALVLHEISHSLGLNEWDATSFQDMILKYVPLAQGAATNYPNQNLDNAAAAYFKILVLVNELDGVSASEQCRLAKSLAYDVVHFADKVFTLNSGNLLETHMSFRFVALQYKAMAYVAQVCYLADPTPKNLKEYNLYAGIFRHFGKDRLTMSEFARGMGLGLRVDIVSDTIPHVRTQSEANLEATSIKVLVQDIYRDIGLTEDFVKQGFLTSRQ